MAIDPFRPRACARIARWCSPIVPQPDYSAATKNWRRKNECYRQPHGEFAPVDDRRAIGPIVDQLHSHAVDRCGPTGQVRTSRHADGAGAARLYALEPGHALRSAGPDLAEPRSVRALQRSCLDAAVV